MTQSGSDLGVLRLFGRTGPHKFRVPTFWKMFFFRFLHHCPLLPSNNQSVNQSMGVRRISFREGLEHMASAVVRTYNGGLEAEPPVGSRGRAPGGCQGAKPP